jgi:hypothetical protein
MLLEIGIHVEPKYKYVMNFYFVIFILTVVELFLVFYS